MMNIQSLSTKAVTQTKQTDKAATTTKSLDVRTNIRAGRGGVPYSD
jgi:hypothetical protein